MLRTLGQLLLGFLVLSVHLQLGKLMVAWLAIPMPGSVVGMVLLFTSLRLGVLEPRVVQPPAELLLRYMALFFVPPGVGLMLYFELLAREWLPIVAATVFSTVAVLCTVGWVQQRLEPNG
jgi:holin-like protein